MPVNAKILPADRVAEILAPLLPAHSSILIGLSGGADSVVLLHLLHKIAPRFSWQLSAVHVHHGISAHADAWAEFCANLCASHNISLHIERVDIAPLRQQGIEAAARKLRHTVFAEQACDFVVLAHHADDQVETLLLQLLRGAGVRGASAMPVLSQSKRPVLSQPKKPALNASRQAPFFELSDTLILLRPLLQFSKQEILAYAAEHKLQWIEDESNADDSYPRNFLRHRVLPLLDKRFPSYRDTLARSAQHFAEASKLLDELAQQDAVQPIVDHTIPVATLQALSHARAKNLLRYFLHGLGAPMPQAPLLDGMLLQLCNAREDATVCIGWGDWQVRRYQGLVYLMPALVDCDPKLVLSWQGETELAWPAMNDSLSFRRTQGDGVSLAKLQNAPVTLRLRSGGEALRLQPKAATRTLKNLLQELHIPPWQRDRLPLLYCGDKLACVPGVAIAAEFRAEAHEEAIRIELQGARTSKA